MHVPIYWVYARLLSIYLPEKKREAEVVLLG